MPNKTNHGSAVQGWKLSQGFVKECPGNFKLSPQALAVSASRQGVFQDTFQGQEVNQLLREPAQLVKDLHNCESAGKGQL